MDNYIQLYKENLGIYKVKVYCPKADLKIVKDRKRFIVIRKVLCNKWQL